MIPRVKHSSSASVCSAADTSTAPGVMVTTIPNSVAAATSTES